jgi:cytochrome c5
MIIRMTKYCGIIMVVLMGLSMQTLHASEKSEVKAVADDFDAEFEAAFAVKIDAEMIVNSFCTKCHMMNQIVDAKNRESHEWVKTLSGSSVMGETVKKSLSSEEIVEVGNYLASSKKTIKPVQVSKLMQTKRIDPEDKSYIASK